MILASFTPEVHVKTNERLMKQVKDTQPPPEQLVADALNEQGYLFQQKIIDVLHAPETSGPVLHKWKIEAPEVPVALPNGDETRIDLVLRPGAGGPRPWHIVMECKRAARDYKLWIFFGTAQAPRGPFPDGYYVETANVVGPHIHGTEMTMDHRVERFPTSTGCPVFDYGLESRLNRPGNDKK